MGGRKKWSQLLLLSKKNFGHYIFWGGGRGGGKGGRMGKILCVFLLGREKKGGKKWTWEAGKEKSFFFLIAVKLFLSPSLRIDLNSSSCAPVKSVRDFLDFMTHEKRQKGGGGKKFSGRTRRGKRKGRRDFKKERSLRGKNLIKRLRRSGRVKVRY